MVLFLAGVNPDTSTSSWRIHMDACPASVMDIPPFVPVLRDSQNTPYIPDLIQVYYALEYFRCFISLMQTWTIIVWYPRKAQSKCYVQIPRSIISLVVPSTILVCTFTVKVLCTVTYYCVMAFVDRIITECDSNSQTSSLDVRILYQRSIKILFSLNLFQDLDRSSIPVFVEKCQSQYRKICDRYYSMKCRI